jgi:hypothetical protein
MMLRRLSDKNILAHHGNGLYHGTQESNDSS